MTRDRCQGRDDGGSRLVRHHHTRYRLDGGGSPSAAYLIDMQTTRSIRGGAPWSFCNTYFRLELAWPGPWASRSAVTLQLKQFIPFAKLIQLCVYVHVPRTRDIGSIAVGPHLLHCNAGFSPCM